MSKRSYNRKRLILFLLAATFFVAVLATASIFFATGISNGYPFLVYIYVFLLPLSGGLTLSTLQMYLRRNQMLNTLRSENSYQLGLDNYFYNYTMFSERVKSLRRHHKNEKGYIIAFTSTNIIGVTQLSQSTRELNGYISDYIRNELSESKTINKNSYAYCYYRNVFIIYSFMNLEDTHALIELVRKGIYSIVDTHELRVFVQPHFGVAEVSNTISLIVGVDNAMYARNMDERNFEELTFYKDDSRIEATTDDIVELSEALQNGEFVVYYQPKFNLKKKKFVGGEALVRWNSKKYGLLSPIKFLKKMEQGGLIHELDTYVLKQVIKDLEGVKRSGRELLPVSVNFSLYEFYSTAFLKELTEIIDRSAIAPELIEIEITETTTQANTFMATSILNRLRSKGYRILMDDFGSGFSNIAQLNSLPFDAIKIDKSLIDGVNSDSKTKDIVKFLIALCKTNDLEVIAEGVDSKEKITILEKMNCDVIQGYYYAEPMPLNEYLDFLNNNQFEKRGGEQ